MTEDEIFAALTQWGCFAADGAVLDAVGRGATGAERTRVAIDSALRALVRNGVIDLPDEDRLVRVGEQGFSVGGVDGRWVTGSTSSL